MGKLLSRRSGALACVVLAVGLVAAGCSTSPFPPPQLYPTVTTTVTSFDGVGLAVNFYPATNLAVGQNAPTVLEGSGWGAGGYSASIGTVDQITIGSQSVGAALVGPQTLNAAGYNVVTWDNRGWYNSGGQVNLDSPAYEGRDVSAIIDWVATQPAAELKGPNDPVVGMTGVSYGGGDQISAAINDHRIAVIEPNMAWNSLMGSLDPNGVVKSGWGSLLCTIGNVVGAKYAPALTSTCTNDLTSGVASPSDISYGDAASPLGRVSQITTPTLLLGGTADTLFPLAQDVANEQLLAAAGTPVKMMWYCGGHGICTVPSGPAGHVVNVEMAFLDKYLKGAQVSTGPAFEYLDQTGTWNSAPAFPPAPAGALTASGSGHLSISTTDSSGFFGVEATPASNALNIAVPAPAAAAEVAGAPQLTVTYQGTASVADTPVFAQLVDTSTNLVVDSQATAVPLVLDGATHTTSVSLNDISWAVTPGSTLELQLTDASDLFFAQAANGSVTVAQATLSLPLSGASPEG